MHVFVLSLVISIPFFFFFLKCLGSNLYSYHIVGSPSIDLDHVEFRQKRDVAQPPSPATPSAPHPAAAVVSTAAAPATLAAAHQTDPPKVENPSRPLLGVNGTGQRKDYSATNGAKATAVSTPSTQPQLQQPSINTENKSLTINQSLGTAQTKLSEAEMKVLNEHDTIIGEIDETDEDFNKTLNKHFADDHLENQVPKTDYFQYYNSTNYIGDRNKSDEYWSQKKDYIISSILSKSHRRAIVSGKIPTDNQIHE